MLYTFNQTSSYDGMIAETLVTPILICIKHKIIFSLFYVSAMNFENIYNTFDISRLWDKNWFQYIYIYNEREGERECELHIGIKLDMDGRQQQSDRQVIKQTVKVYIFHILIVITNRKMIRQSYMVHPYKLKAILYDLHF